MIFVGLDPHKRYITACALDVAGGVIGEVRRMKTTSRLGSESAVRGARTLKRLPPRRRAPFLAAEPDPPHVLRLPPSEDRRQLHQRRVAIALEAALDR